MTLITYLANGVTLGAASTDASGNLTISTAQGGTGTLPTNLDLVTIKTISFQTASGETLATASF